VLEVDLGSDHVCLQPRENGANDLLARRDAILEGLVQDSDGDIGLHGADQASRGRQRSGSCHGL
jgi:hypothetical protein